MDTNFVKKEAEEDTTPDLMEMEAISDDEFFGDIPVAGGVVIPPLNQQAPVENKRGSGGPCPATTDGNIWMKSEPLDAEDISEEEGEIPEPSQQDHVPLPPTYETSQAQLPPPPLDESESEEGQIQERENENGDLDEPTDLPCQDEEKNDEVGDDDMSSDSEDEQEVGAEEIDDLLEEGLPEEFQRRSKPKYSVKELLILEEKGKNSLESLPEGWLEVRHTTGIPVYLHRKSRVCTLAKPYSLGPSSVRKHLLPLSGIPCLSYRRALEREEKEEKEAQEVTLAREVKEVVMEEGEDGVSPPKKFKDDSSPPPLTFVPLPPAKLETAEETNILFTVQPEELRDYCSKLFKFRTIQCKRFKNWNAKRNHTKMQKRLKVQRPTLPDGVKLIKFPVKPLGNGDNNGRGNREYVLNPKGKSSVCILHEYVQHALRQQPVYQFKELDHASTPYSATVLINSIQYGTGYGTSKKQAKANAAKETLQVLIPQIKDSLSPPEKKIAEAPSTEVGYTECFGQIELDDRRIATLCQNISEPTPYSLLLTCIQRNYGKMSEGGLQFEMVSTLPNQKIKFKMSFKEHTVEIIASNKKEGKQVASQTMLARIHPHIKNFGAFIRLYGNDSIKSCKEKKQDQQEVTELQSKASVNSPNFAILAKLREEMRKLCAEETEGEMENGSVWLRRSTQVTRITREPIRGQEVNQEFPSGEDERKVKETGLVMAV